MRRPSITLRLTLFFSTASTLVLLAIGYWVGTMVETHFEEEDQHQFETKLTLIRHALSQAHTPDELTAAAQRIADALVGHHGLSVSITGPEGQTLFATPDAALLAPLLESGADTSRPLVWTWEGESYRGILTTAQAPPLRIAIALNIGHHLEFLSAFRKSLWLAIAVCILLTALLGWIAARRGLAPLRDMARVAHGISASRLAQRLQADDLPAELTPLAHAFNDMLGRLEDSFRRLSDFSLDIAHELRTPISNLMTQTQVALSQTRSADEYREVLYSNLEEYDRLARMIGDMLFLAQADNGLIVPHKEAIDLAEEARQLFDFYEALADEQGVRLELAGAGRLQGDRLMLRRALSNLLSNALRHTPRDGAITVSISHAGAGEVRIAVENTGRTIPPEHLPRLFERFYQVDPSRQRTHEGAGLGLAITKSIVEAHGGAIAVTSAEGRSRFEAVFPAG